MNMRIHHLLWYLSLLCWHPVFSQFDSPVKGQVLDSIPLSANSKESFALYLPKNFDTDTLSTILFIFDPGGKGSSGVWHFIPAAEEYNYILVCSNNVKNGPYETNLAITARLLNIYFHNSILIRKGYAQPGFQGVPDLQLP